MNHFARIDTSLLFPHLLEVLRLVLSECSERGADYVATCGFRSAEDQSLLYAQGRTVPGPVVTRARPWESAHQFGLAVDFVRDVNRARAGVQPSWRRKDYELLGEVSERHGLLWGGSFQGFPDLPHVQWPRFVTARDLAPLAAAAVSGPLDNPRDYLRRAWAVLPSAGMELPK